MFEETLAQLKVNLVNPANRVFPLKEAIQTAKEKLKPRKFIRKSISNFTLDIKQIDYVSIIKNTI